MATTIDPTRPLNEISNLYVDNQVIKNKCIFVHVWEKSGLSIYEWRH